MQIDCTEFDYVVVGGGAAGCVVANRLSANPANRVCLLEAGPMDSNPAIRVPLAFMILSQLGIHNWGYETLPEPATADRRIPFPQGKVLGGTSSINGTVYMRGHPSDYDGWAALGNTGWGYDEVLPYFRRAENNVVFQDSPFHGTGGPVTVSNPTHIHDLARRFVAAAEACGIPPTPDFNGESQEGAGIRQLFQKNGRRVSSASAYIAPVRKRRNLTIIPGFHASRLRIAEGRCTGVDGLQEGRPATITARREVIVSSGTIGSPALLLRSGIGDGGALSALGIASVRHSPGVGANYQDHVNIVVRHDDPGRTSYGLSLRSAGKLTWAPLEYLLFRRGLLASNLAYAGAFLRTDAALNRPDVQLIFWPAHKPPGKLAGAGHSYQVMTHLLRPDSRGRVSLASPRVTDKPHIATGVLSEASDVRTLLAGIKVARAVMRQMGGGAELEPGADVVSDEALTRYMRETAVMGLHCAGTCRMGPDAESVVDPELRVRGVEGLRVADASIMPTLIGGNTAAPAMMIGEKVSDMILAASHSRIPERLDAKCDGHIGTLAARRSGAWVPIP
ncbi:MAG TPA: GMC family oxidoreductase N-terminal domain-containing protein [Sphingopyxis sp.]|nr:GMC family oxidoreductase N-terminal domain-containing protein [Sphingopyxis sp.]HET6526377.1 GMC family oxidoreductase N-terminal domain-containing protein [Sphingopyxis sp.]